MAVTAQQIHELYVAYWGRAADPAGLAYWLAEGQKPGVDQAKFAQAFAAQAEATGAYALLKTPALVADADAREGFIKQIYQNLFNRSADDAGLKYWSDELAAKGLAAVGIMIAAISKGAQGDDAKVLANKVTASAEFVKQAGQANLNFDYSADADKDGILDFAEGIAKEVLGKIDATPASLEAALKALAEKVAIAATANGQTIALTTSTTDVAQGNAGNDLFLGQVTDSNQPTAANTLHASDVIVGGEGKDTLRVTADGEDSEVTGFTMSGVETLEVRSYGKSVELGLVNVQGLQKVISTTSTGDITLNNVQNQVELELTGNGSTDIDVAVNYAGDAVLGAQKLLLDRFDGKVTAAGVTSVEIVTKDRASDLTADFAQADSFKVSGNADLFLDGMTSVAPGIEALALKTLDASALTGDLVALVTNRNNSQLIDVKGGSGDDLIIAQILDTNVKTNFAGGAGDDTLVLSTLVKDDGKALGNVIAGGEGNDTLVLMSEDLRDIAVAGSLANASSLETLVFAQEVTDGASGFDGVATGANAAGVRTYVFEKGAAVDVDMVNMADNTTLVLNDDVQNLSFTLATAEDKATGNVTNLVANIGQEVLDLEVLTIEGAETLNISANDLTQDKSGALGFYDVANSANIGSVLNSSTLTTLNIAGNAEVDFNEVNAAKLAKVDASALVIAATDADQDGLTIDLEDVAAKIEVIGSNGDDHIHLNSNESALTADGGAGDDHLEGNALADILKGGAGDDRLDGEGGDDVLDGGDGNDDIDAGAGIDTVTGGKGDDYIRFAAAELTSADAIDGGEGQDTLEVVGGPLVGKDDFFYKWKSVETLRLSNLGNNDLRLNAIAHDAGIATILSTGGDDKLVIGEGFTRALTVELSGGGDVTVDAAISNAGLTVKGAAAEFTAADVLTGGKGTADVLQIVTDNGVAQLGNQVTGFETIQLVKDAADSVKDVHVVTNNANVAAGATLKVDGSALGADNRLAFDGRAETDGQFDITGGAGNDEITGGAKADIINGGAGNDEITGGLGKDLLDGGAGVDSFIYTAAAESNGVNIDVISNFNVAEDLIDLNQLLNLQPGQTVDYVGEVNGYGQMLSSLDKTYQNSLSDGLPGEIYGQVRAVLDTADSTLYVDVNGDGDINDADLVIKLAGVTDLSDANFVFVI